MGLIISGGYGGDGTIITGGYGSDDDGRAIIITMDLCLENSIEFDVCTEKIMNQNFCFNNSYDMDVFFDIPQTLIESG